MEVRAEKDSADRPGATAALVVSASGLVFSTGAATEVMAATGDREEKEDAVAMAE
jgi:hypothetical protein